MHDTEITVLLIEDNPSDALLVKYIIDEIEWLQIRLITVNNLTKAFNILDEQHVDLVLLDLMLPDSSDRYTFNKLFAVNNQIPVVVLSGIDDKDVALDAIKEGAQDYLVKGEFDGKLLERTMRYAIERSKLLMAQKKSQQDLQAQDELLKLITNISATFINLSSEQIDQGIEQALSSIGKFLQADKAFIFELSESNYQAIQNHYEWSSLQTNSSARFFENISPEMFTELLHHLHKNNIMRCLNVNELSDNFSELKLSLQTKQIQSFILVALFYKKQVTAVLGLATINRYGYWSSETISLLNTSGEVFYRAIKKKQSEERIKESERKYRILIENMDEGLIYVNEEGSIQFANRSMCSMVGYTYEELMGKHLIHDIIGDNDQKNGNGVLNMLQSRRDLSFTQYYEIPIKRKNGEKIWVIMNNHPLEDENGKKIASMGTLVNITDRKKAEERLKQANEDLRTFIYRASHDLRGPLASVLGITNLASMEITDPRALQYFSYISKSTHKLDKTLKTLIDVATITQPDEVYLQIDFEKLVKEIINTLNYTNSLEDLSITLDVNQKYPFISNKQLLVYIFEKLIENAVAFRKDDECQPKLFIKIYVNEMEAGIEIEDNGVGIPKELQQKVFNMFFKASEKSRGSGLGLYIVDKLVGRLHGSISLSSQVNVGTQFKICLKSL